MFNQYLRIMFTKKFLILVALMTLSAVLAGCRKEDNYDPASNPLEDIVLTRAEDQCNDASKPFAFNLLEAVNKQEKGKSYFFSPLSIEFALGLLASGTEGETLRSICDALGVEDIEALNSYSKKMMETLPSVDKRTTLSIANLALFNNNKSVNIEPKREYSKTIENYYKALVKSMDFGSDKTINFINDWASDKTKGTIKKVISRDQIKNNDYFVLANALYFNGKWFEIFEKTEKEDFTLENGKKVRTEMMSTTKERRCAVYDSFKSLDLTYGNAAYKMTVLLPEEGYTCDRIIPDLRKAFVDKTLTPNDSGSTRLAKIPKFSGSFQVGLKKIFSELGISFNGVDFKKMTPDEMKDLVINAWQNSFIKVNEKGTEAAAVTIMVGMTGAIISAPHLEFIADRPFLYMITEQSTGAILFMGKYTGE